jgi:23S rRNA (guanine2445-N2)-methyltransferase / 23S rRNA (guanine2069-N7)-methyltransferase
VTDAAELLAQDGVLVFSTNLRTFKLDHEALGHLSIEDISAATIPPDFARSPRIHQCFLVRRG